VEREVPTTLDQASLTEVTVKEEPTQLAVVPEGVSNGGQAQPPPVTVSSPARHGNAAQKRAEIARLHESERDSKAIFLRYLLKGVRQSVPEGGPSRGLVSRRIKT
jgi:hypothetical protein